MILSQNMVLKTKKSEGISFLFNIILYDIKI
jgi:hypothetical protein